MLKYHHIICCLLLTLLFSACEKKTEWELQKGSIYLTADCIITNEMKQHELWLYWSADSMNAIYEGMTGASATLFDGQTTYSLHADPEKAGRYLTDIPFVATADRIYRLAVSYSGPSGIIYDTAFATMTGVTQMEPFIAQTSGDYFKYDFKPAGSAYMLEIFYNWSADAGYCEEYGSCTASETYYNLENIDADKVFAPDRMEILFPQNTRIIRRKYSLSHEHQEFVRSLLLETDWRGGIFDTEQGNVLTNFSNGTLGWFAVCSVVSDTVLFK